MSNIALPAIDQSTINKKEYIFKKLKKFYFSLEKKRYLLGLEDKSNQHLNVLIFLNLFSNYVDS